MAGDNGWDPTTPYVPRSGAAAPAPGPDPTPPNRTLLLGLGAVVAVLVFAILAVVATALPHRAAAPAATAAVAGRSCPTYPRSSAPPLSTADGRVHGGNLSYPLLTAPWSPPRAGWRTPFTVDSSWQWLATETDPSGSPSWVAGIEVAELTSGDGMPHPADAHELVLDCIMGTYETAVARTYVASRAAKVTGRDAWYVEAHLSFDKPGILAKAETVLLLIVRTGPDATSMFYASIPDGNPGPLADARRALDGLRVD